MEEDRVKFTPDRVDRLINPKTFDRFMRVKFYTRVDFYVETAEKFNRNEFTPEEYEAIGRQIIQQAVDQITEKLD